MEQGKCMVGAFSWCVATLTFSRDANLEAARIGG